MVAQQPTPDPYYAWITGGASGLGLAFARALASNGAKGIAIVDLDAAAGADAARELRRLLPDDATVYFQQCDVADTAQLEGTLQSAVTAFGGRLNLVVNNAGIRDEACLHTHFAVNVYPVIRGTTAAVDIMRETCRNRSAGSVINVASAAGVYPLPESKLYTASKHAVVGFTRCFSESLARDNVKVNALCPGFADTAFISDMKKSVAGKQMLKSLGVMSPTAVAHSLLQLVALEKSGEVLYTSANTGAFYPLSEQVERWRAIVSERRRDRGPDRGEQTRRARM